MRMLLLPIGRQWMYERNWGTSQQRIPSAMSCANTIRSQSSSLDIKGLRKICALFTLVSFWGILMRVKHTGVEYNAIQSSKLRESWLTRSSRERHTPFRVFAESSSFPWSHTRWTVQHRPLHFTHDYLGKETGGTMDNVYCCSTNSTSSPAGSASGSAVILSVVVYFVLSGLVVIITDNQNGIFNEMN